MEKIQIDNNLEIGVFITKDSGLTKLLLDGVASNIKIHKASRIEDVLKISMNKRKGKKILAKF